MACLDYMEIPACATLVQPDKLTSDKNSKRVVTLPAPSKVAADGSVSQSLNVSTPSSPSGSKASFTNALLSSTLFLPTLPDNSTFSTDDREKLLSNREPLSIPTTTVNFRRFVSRSGPVFWLQDRIEEVIMWKKGWKTTCTWMVLYSLLCIFPRLFLLLPNVIIISILLETYNSAANSEHHLKSSDVLPKEGSTEWFANLQAIQNLMGTVSDAHDIVVPWLPIMTWNSPYTTHLFTLVCLSTIFLIPVMIHVPLTPVLLITGLLPLFCTHPRVLRVIPLMFRSLLRKGKNSLQRLIDNDNLSDAQWYAEKREVELFENERWLLGSGWSKASLKPDEKPWSSTYIKDNGQRYDANDLIFTLPSQWDFIPSETWSLDFSGISVPCGVDENGWVYYDDSWQNGSNIPLEEWRSKGMVRRRRWTHRIYSVSAL